MKTKFKQTEIGKIPEEWDVKEFQEVGQINMGQSPKSETYNEVGNGLPFYQGRRDFGRKYPTVGVYCTDPKKIAIKGDVLLTVRAPVGEVNEATEECCIGRGVSALRLDNGNNEFLYYLMKYYERKWRGLETGTVFGAIKKDDLRYLKIPLPSNEEQRHIASILGALDDKIELNNQMNRTLEEMASAIFKSWFVDFKPFRDGEFEYNEELDKEIPKGWGVEKIGDVLELAYGKGLREKDRKPGNINVFGSSGIVGIYNEKLVDGPGIVIGRKGTAGTVIWSHSDFFPIDTTFYVVPKGRISSLYFLFHELRAQDLPHLVADSAVPGLNRNMVYMNKMVVPPKNIIDEFDRLVIPLFNQMKINDAENKNLEEIRNALLPKLLSGEIRVNIKEAKVGK